MGVRRDHRLHAAEIRHDAFGRLAVRLTAEDASPKGGPHCHWADEVVRRAVAQPSRLADELIEARIDIVGELNLGDRAQAVSAHPDRDADDAALDRKSTRLNSSH